VNLRNVVDLIGRERIHVWAGRATTLLVILIALVLGYALALRP
jgi:hypothetical protein